MNFDKNDNGVWIFVSHSHKDLVEVRKVRNELEKLGHNPLLFYLKCMDEDNEQLPDLIKKEIQARSWFVLCESKNSKSSHWVKKEVEIIKAMPAEKRVYKSINLEKSLEPQIEKLIELSKRATIFLLYHRNDLILANEIYRRLKAEDYRVFDPTKDLSIGDDFQKEISINIDEAIQHGFVLILLSPTSLMSEWVKLEISYVFEKSVRHKNNILPILIKDMETDFDFASVQMLTLSKIQWLDFTSGNLQEHLTRLISYLKTKRME